MCLYVCPLAAARNCFVASLIFRLRPCMRDVCFCCVRFAARCLWPPLRPSAFIVVVRCCSSTSTTNGVRRHFPVHLRVRERGTPRSVPPPRAHQGRTVPLSPLALCEHRRRRASTLTANSLSYDVVCTFQTRSAIRSAPPFFLRCFSPLPCASLSRSAPLRWRRARLRSRPRTGRVGATSTALLALPCAVSDSECVIRVVLP